jgi:hypothetical protein
MWCENIAQMVWNEMLLLTKGKTTQTRFVMEYVLNLLARSS